MITILAVGSSFFFAVTYVFTRVGLKYCNPLSGVLISTLSSMVLSLAIFIFTISIEELAHMAVLFFVAGGILGVFLARLLLYVGIDRVGAAIASPLSEIKPLFSGLAAILILGEKFTYPIALGMFSIIIGSITISSEQSGGKIDKKWKRKDLIYPVLAGACWGLAHFSRKIGLNVIPNPIVGVTLQNATVLVFFPLLTLNRRTRLVLNNKNAWSIFSIVGLFTFFAHICLFYALKLGDLVIVTPLASVSPFFVLVFAGIFMKKLERVTLKIVIGAVFIVGGTALLSLLSPN